MCVCERERERRRERVQEGEGVLCVLCVSVCVLLVYAYMYMCVVCMLVDAVLFDISLFLVFPPQGQSQLHRGRFRSRPNIRRCLSLSLSLSSLLSPLFSLPSPLFSLLNFIQEVTFPLENLEFEEIPRSDEVLTWQLRVRIALDVSRGLAYLHSREPPIVHKDVRSPNIFICHLDPLNVVAKVQTLLFFLPSFPLFLSSNLHSSG